MHTAFLLNQIEESDQREKYRIRGSVERAEQYTIEKLTKHCNMQTDVGEEA